MSKLLKEINERTSLASNSRLELLIFTFEKDTKEKPAERFGINVFKIKTILETPQIASVPGMPDAMEGVVKIRDTSTPIINLAKHCGIDVPMDGFKILLVTEYSKNIQGFLVNHVERIARVEWKDVESIPKIMEQQKNGMVTALIEIEGIGLVQLLDVEKALADISGSHVEERDLRDVVTMEKQLGSVFFADDSLVARGQIKKTITHMNLDYVESCNGLECWQRLDQIADDAIKAGEALSDYVTAIVTDIEMPEMDGFTLTKKLKSDKRFKGIPVIIHSSLSGQANEELGKSVGVDAYVAKFDANELANTIAEVIKGHH
jgi:two-component system chemotaxis response regulator CheV